ncbi:MAG: outer membrane lipoprotein-sorting protein [Candidatus Margulisiibacteriota bacterium]
MKTKTLLILLTILIFCASLSAAPPSPNMTTADILKKMEATRDYDTAQMLATMEIINSNGEKTSMSLISYEKTEGDLALMRFTSPARLKGTAILTKGDDIWYYNNRSGRVRLLSRSAKKGSMMGSGFSYDDMSTDYQKDYNAVILKETKDEYTLKMAPKDEDKDYKYLLVTLPKDTFVATEVDYYNHNEQLYKKMTVGDIKNIGGHITPLTVSMKEISAQKITNFIIDEEQATFNIEIDEEMFSERYLKK